MLTGIALKGSRRTCHVSSSSTAGSQPRPSPRPDCTGDTLVGRGIAYAQRSGAVVAVVADVEIDRHTGKIGNPL